MLRRSSLVLALSLTMPLLSLALPGRAATTPKVIKQAVGEKDPLAFTSTDSADGKLGTDSKFAGQVHDMFANTVWLFLDDGSLVIGRKNGDTLNALFTPAMVTNDKNTYFLFHLRTQNGIFLDGTVNTNISSKDPTLAYAEMTLLMMGDKGASATTHIEQYLTVQGETAPQNQPSGLPSVP